MPDEHELRQQIARGQRVANLLDDPELKGAFDKVRAKCVKTILDSQGGQTELREHSWQMAKAVAEVEDELRATIREGSAAKVQLAALEANKDPNEVERGLTPRAPVLDENNPWV